MFLISILFCKVSQGDSTLQQSAKVFSEKLNKCLDELGTPTNIRERTSILSKMLHIPKQQAWALLEGHLYPDKILLHEIITELEVDPKVFS